MAEYTNVVVSGTTRNVNSGDKYTSTTVTAAGLLQVLGGSAIATDLNDNGRLWVQNAGYVSGVSAAGGSCRISAFHAGTVLYDVHIDSGVNAIGTPRLDIRESVRVSGATVSGAFVQVKGELSGAMLDKNAQLYVINGGYAQDINAVNTNDVRFYSNGSGSNITVMTGLLQVYNTAACYNVVVGNRLWMGSNGYVSGALIHSNGSAQLHSSGALIENVTLTSGGSNAVAYPNLDIRAGRAVNVVASGAAIQVLSQNGAAAISGVTLEANAQMVVYTNASAQDITVNSGTFRLWNGASATGVTVGAKGTVNISAANVAAVADQVIVQNGGNVDINTASATNVTVDQGGKILIRNSAYVSNATINGSAEMYTGLLSGATVAGSRLALIGGGTVRGVQILSNGTAFVSGTDANIEDVHINSGGRNQAAYPNLDIRTGRGNNIVASGAAIQVLNAAATISGVVMEENATMVVYNNASAQGVTVNSGTFSLYNTATATGVTANSGGIFNVSNAASVDTATVTDGGRMLVTATGSATNVSVSSGGRLNNFSWNYDLNLAEITNGTATIAPSVIMMVDKLHVREGGSASGTTNSNGSVYVSNGGVYTDGVVKGDTTDAIYAIVYNGGLISNTSILGGARVDVSSGGSAEDIVVSGRMLVLRQASATNCSAIGTGRGNYVQVQNDSLLTGGYFANDGEFRGNAGSAVDLVFENGGSGLISAGFYTSKFVLRDADTIVDMDGTALDGTVSGGTLNINGGTMDTLTVSAGSAVVKTGATATTVTVAGGNVSVDAGATLNVATVAGRLDAVNGGVANDVTVNNGGIACASNGGLISSALAKSGGMIFVSAGSGANLSTEKGARIYIENNGFVSGATLSGYTEVSNATLSSATIANGSSLRLYVNGYAENVWVDNTEVVARYTGAVLSNAYISGGKITSIQSNAIARNLTQSTGRLRLDGNLAGTVSGANLTSVYAEVFSHGVISGYSATAGSTYVYSGGQLLNGTAFAGNSIYVSGGVGSDITVNSGARLSAMSGGALQDLVVRGGYAELQTGATLDGATVMREGAAGDLRVYNGYATNVNLSGAQAQIVFRWSTASGSEITASDGAYLQVQNGAVASNVTVSGARLILGMAPETTGNTGSVYGATLTSAQVDIVSGGIVSGFTAEAGSMFVSAGATLEDGTVTGDDAVVNILAGATANNVAVDGGNFKISAGATGNDITVGEDGAATVAGTLNVKTSAWNVTVADGGVVNVEAGESVVNVNTVAGARVNVTKDGAGASLKGDKTNIAEGTLYYSGAQLAATAVNGVLTGLNAGTVYKLSIGDDILVNDVTLNNGEIRISCFDGASVDGATVSAGAIICNVAAYGTMDNVTLIGAGIMNLSGTAQANNTVVSNGGQFALNAATVKAENTVLKAGAILKVNAAGADTGERLTLDFTGTTGNQSLTISGFANVADHTEIMLVGETAGNTYTIATTGATNKYVNCGEWGLYDDRIKAGETITNAFTSMTYTFDATGKSIAVTEFVASSLASAGSIADGTTINGNGKAAKWTSATTATGTIKAATSAIAGDAWLELDGANLAGTTLYGAEAGFANGVNLYATNDATVGNLAAGAEAGGTVGAVKLTVDDATVGLAYAGGFGNVTGKTETLIGTGATMTKDFYAGALANYAKTGSSTHAGDITLDIAAGTFSGNIYGAASVKAGAATGIVHSVQNVTINVTGGESKKGTQACLFAGGYATGSTTSKVYTVTSVNTTISGGTWGEAAGGRGVFGGIFASNVTAEAGDVTLTVTGGSFGNVYGGGWAQKNGTSIVGDVSISIAGGTIANVFGGGTHSTSGGTTSAASVSINVSGGNITGDIYARGQADGDVVSGAVDVTFTGDTNFGCGVYGYSYVGGEASGAVLSYTAYTGTFSGKLGGFDSIAFDDDTAMTLTTAAADVSNGKWEFDFTDRDATLSGTSFLTWSTADFAGDTVNVTFADETQAKAGWSIADAAFTGATFGLTVGAVELTGIAYDTAISGTGTAYDGWGFTLEESTLKFKQLA